jgi:hypothetical protein
VQDVRDERGHFGLRCHILLQEVWALAFIRLC